MVNYKGFEHFPIGNAQLTVNATDELVVSNLISCGDGVLIRTQVPEWHLEYLPITYNNNGTMSVTYFGKDGFGRIKAVGQLAYYFDNVLQKGAVAINSRMMGKKIRIIGMNGSVETYNYEFDNPTCDCPETEENWIIVVVGVIMLIGSLVSYKKVIDKDGEGKVVSETTTYDFGNGGRSIAYQGPNDVQFDADKLFVISTNEYDPAIDDIYSNEMDSVQISVCNIPQFTISNEVAG